MKKLVFIINSIQAQRCIKRINEFVSEGFEIEIYGFKREFQVAYELENLKINIIETIPKSMNYYNRFFLLKRELKKIIDKYKDKDIIFYYFGFDIALISNLLTNKKYIYEESDLSYSYLRNPVLEYILKFFDKLIITNSLETVFTSEGFKIFHFKKGNPSNISIIPNKLNVSILKEERIIKPQINDLLNLKIGFVGGIRYKSILNFATVFVQNFPHYEFHFYGDIIGYKKEFDDLKKYPNVFFHGVFKNPQDLSWIYSQIDLVLSTYDIESKNVLYAEPNKLYESIYFETPIIVSRGTFLSTRVKKLDVGFCIDPLDKKDIISFIKMLTPEIIQMKRNSCKQIPIEDLINKNSFFFEKISKK